MPTAAKTVPSPKGASTSSVKKFTWQEVAQHNTASSCWVYVDKKVYDITSWVPQHPGGQEMLLLVAGRDATDMFKSYHPFSEKPTQVLAKFEIGEIAESEFPQYKPDSGFYKTLCSRVKEHFDKSGQDPKDPTPGLIRLAVFLVLAAYSFSVAYDSSRNWFVRIIAAQIYGVMQALPLLHCMHDASHTSIGGKPMYWRVIGRLTLDWFAGASMTSWHNQHIIGHHLYTNVLGVDPDLPVEKSGDIRRVARHQYWAPFYRFQHYYLAVLYGVLALKFRVQDIVGIMSASNGKIRVNITDYSEHIWQFFVKTSWLCWRILLPIYLWNNTTGQTLALFFISEFVTGYYLAFNFQVSHVSPCTAFPEMQQNAPTFDDEWAISQVKTTVDYSHGDWFMTLLCGALNYQTVHHLFPSVSQYHYPALAPIIMKTCKEYNITYNCLPTFFEAVKCHFAHLQQLGDKATDIHH